MSVTKMTICGCIERLVRIDRSGYIPAQEIRSSLGNTEKSTTRQTTEEPQPDVEMQAIGYPAPTDQASFARRLAEIIQRALRRQKSS